MDKVTITYENEGKVGFVFDPPIHKDEKSSRLYFAMQIYELIKSTGEEIEGE